MRHLLYLCSRSNSDSFYDPKIEQICRLDEIKKIIIHKGELTHSQCLRLPESMTLIFKPYIERKIRDEYQRLDGVLSHPAPYMPGLGIVGSTHINKHLAPEDYHKPAPSILMRSSFDEIKMQRRPHYTPKNLCENSSTAMVEQFRYEDGDIMTNNTPGGVNNGAKGKKQWQYNYTKAAGIIPFRKEVTLGYQGESSQNKIKKTTSSASFQSNRTDGANNARTSMLSNHPQITVTAPADHDNESGTGSASSVEYNKIMLSVVPNMSFGPTEDNALASMAKRISYKGRRKPRFQITIENFDFGVQNDYKQRVHNPLKGDGGQGSAFEVIERNAYRIRDLAHWRRVFESLGIQVEDETAENAEEVGVKMSERQKVFEVLRRKERAPPPALPIFCAGYLRCVNRDSKLSYYVLDSSALTCYEDSSRRQLIHRYYLRDIYSITKVNQQNMEKKISKMKELIDDHFRLLMEDMDIDIDDLLQDDMLGQMNWEQKLILVLKPDLEDSTVAHRLLGAFGLDEKLMSNTNANAHNGSQSVANSCELGGFQARRSGSPASVRESGKKLSQLSRTNTDKLSVGGKSYGSDLDQVGGIDRALSSNSVSSMAVSNANTASQQPASVSELYDRFEQLGRKSALKRRSQQGVSFSSIVEEENLISASQASGKSFRGSTALKTRTSKFGVDADPDSGNRIVGVKPPGHGQIDGVPPTSGQRLSTMTQGSANMRTSMRTSRTSLHVGGDPATSRASQNNGKRSLRISTANGDSTSQSGGGTVNRSPKAGVGSTPLSANKKNSALLIKSKHLPAHYTGQIRDPNVFGKLSNLAKRKKNSNTKETWLSQSSQSNGGSMRYTAYAGDRMGLSPEDKRKNDTEARFGMDRITDFSIKTMMSRFFYARPEDIEIVLKKMISSTQIQAEFKQIIINSGLHKVPSSFLFQKSSNSFLYEQKRVLGMLSRALAETKLSQHLSRYTILRVLGTVAKLAQEARSREEEQYNYIYRRKSFLNALLPFVTDIDEDGRMLKEFLSCVLLYFMYSITMAENQ